MSHHLKESARKLRNDSTLAEVLLWRKLKGKQLGYKFNRQKIIGKYIVDFFCCKLKMVIEIDGASHGDKEEYDRDRDEYIESEGYTILRFLDSEVKSDIDGVMRAIGWRIDEYEG